MAMVMESTKACTKCGVVKSVVDFPKRGDITSKPASWCKQCEKERRRDFYEKNKRKINAQNNDWRKQNKSRTKESNKKWYEKNKKRVKENAKTRRKNNPEKEKEMHLRRKVRMKQNGVYQITVKDLKKLYMSQCVCCGSTKRISADHVIPIVRGGRHSIGNLQALCVSCNSSKNDKLMIEWKLQKRKEAIA